MYCGTKTMKYYSVLKRNELPIKEMTWGNLIPHEGQGRLMDTVKRLVVYTVKRSELVGEGGMNR